MIEGNQLKRSELAASVDRRDGAKVARLKVRMRMRMQQEMR
jgi:hypothetical protein